MNIAKLPNLFRKPLFSAPSHVLGRRRAIKQLSRDEARRISLSCRTYYNEDDEMMWVWSVQTTIIMPPSVFQSHEGGRFRRARYGKSLSQTGRLARLRFCIGE